VRQHRSVAVCVGHNPIIGHSCDACARHWASVPDGPPIPVPHPVSSAHVIAIIATAARAPAANGLPLLDRTPLSSFMTP
jgi:hypothetical protein